MPEKNKYRKTLHADERYLEILKNKGPAAAKRYRTEKYGERGKVLHGAAAASHRERMYGDAKRVGVFSEIKEERRQLLNDKPVEFLLSNNTIRVPTIYGGGDPLDSQREQDLIRYITQETRKALKDFLKKARLTLPEEKQVELQNKLVRLAHITAYIRSIYDLDDYLDNVLLIINKTKQVLYDAFGSTDIVKTNLNILAKIIIRKGGSSLTYTKNVNYANRLNIANTAEANIIQEQGAEVALDSIDKMRQGALLWYYQKITGDDKASIPEGMTLEKLLKENYRKVLNMRRAVGYTLPPIGGALVGGALTAGTSIPVLGHLAAIITGGAMGLAGSTRFNKRSRGVDKMYQAQLLTSLHKLNKKLRDDVYVSKPKRGWLLNKLGGLLDIPPSLGSSFSKLSRSELNYILDQKTMTAHQRQKAVKLVIATLGAVVATYPHLGDSGSVATITPTPMSESVATVEPAVNTFKNFWSTIFKPEFWTTWNGEAGNKFSVPTLGYCSQC